jgi:hypothetical protein
MQLPSGDMAMWSCPHCGTPQEETARCWVCRRSTVCCATCRHFSRAVAGDLAYCGLDRGRRPLHGDEIRPCWEQAPTAIDANDRSNPLESRPGLARDFVPLAPADPELGDPPGRPRVVVGESGWTLFADGDL